jgi:hydroxymethylglutaryl-CoA lyase
MGMANVVAGLDMGITTFDSSLGGLGGCPYAPGATGNIASEDLLYLLGELGVESGINLDKVIAASREIAGVLNRELPSRYLRSHLAKVLRV